MKTKVLFYDESITYLDCYKFVKEKIDEIKTNVIKYKKNLKNETENDTYLIMEKIKNCITSKEFNYQSKIKIQHQFPRMERILLKKIENREPLDFYLDLGGGYHANIGYEQIDKNNNALFSELVTLLQISKFVCKISDFYSFGVRMNIILDNLVAYYVNNIELKRTELYCKQLRELIKNLEMENIVNIFLESEKPQIQKKLCHLKWESLNEITQEQYENILRFQESDISFSQAKEKYNKYIVYVSASEQEINSIIGEQIRFVQRSDNNELTFRTFPGGASRIQCGQIGLIYNSEKKKIQMELFTQNKIKKMTKNHFSIFEMEII